MHIEICDYSKKASYDIIIWIKAKGVHTYIMEKKKNKWLGKIIVIALAVVAVVSYFCVPSIHDGFDKIANMFYSGDFTIVRDFVDSYGGYAAAVSFVLMILQSIAAPLPAFLLTVANANLFGWWQGAILSWSSAMAGAAVCFYIARILGRDVVIKLNGKNGIKQIEEFFDKHGNMSILVARLLPFISFDIVKTGENRAVVQNVVFEPTVFHFPSNFYNNHIYFMKDYSEDLAYAHGVRTYYQNKMDFATLKGFLRDTISDEFLSESTISLINEN